MDLEALDTWVAGSGDSLLEVFDELLAAVSFAAARIAGYQDELL